jgi:membrane AbrB-like protein
MTAAQLLLLLVLGGTGSAVGRLLRLPMWPLTGAILGAGTYHLLGFGATTTPAWLSLAGQLLVGCAVGSAVGRDLFTAVRRVTAPGAVVVVSIIGLGAAGGVTFALAGLLEPTPALLGSIPGGVGEMVAAAAGLGADSALVAGMHLVRLFLVLSILPWVLRWARGWRVER